MTDTTKLMAPAPQFGIGRETAPRPADQVALGELSTVLAHELRNPLSSIKGAAQILMQEWGHLKPQGEFLSIILDEVDALTALTTEFLDFARPLYPELTWGSWKDIVGRAVESVRPLAVAAGIEILLTHDGAQPSVLLDHYQVERAVRNLILNAVEASSQGDTVMVITSWDSRNLTVTVVDSGLGVPSDQMARVFVPFYTTKLTGTGLGLPVARKIAQQHGGDVSAAPNDGPGMTFCIHLPASGEA